MQPSYIAHTLTELVLDNRVGGTLRLYVHRAEGPGYDLRQYFARDVRYPNEEIDIEEAKKLTGEAVAKGREVRITNGADNLVFHAYQREVLFPKEGADHFWQEVQKA